MKNGKLVTAYLDECAELSALSKTDSDAWEERMFNGSHDELWRAVLDDGWTIAEMDAAYERRFGQKVSRPTA